MRKRGIWFICVSIYCLSFTACYQSDRTENQTDEETDSADKVEEEIQREMEELNEKENGKEQEGYDIPMTEEETSALKAAATKVAMSYQKELEQVKNGKKDMGDLTAAQMETLVTAAASSGEAVTDASETINMENYVKVEQAFLKINQGEEATAVINQITQSGSLYRSEFCYQSGALTVKHIVASFTDKGEVLLSGLMKNVVQTYQYTESGRFLYEEASESGSEMTNGNAIIRIRPQKQEYLMLCNKYIKPIGYQGTNLFLTDWTTDDLKDLDLNDTFESFYQLKTQTVLEAEKYSDGIPKDEFEEIMTGFLGIKSKDVLKHAKFDKKKQTYRYISLGCGNYSPDMWGVPYPEVTDVKEEKNGIVELTVQAVWPERLIEKAFVHKVTVKLTGEGGIQFLGNKVVKDEENVLITYHHRIS